MSINIKEYCVHIDVTPNDRSRPYHSAERKVAVDSGNVDINDIVQDMIDSIPKVENLDEHGMRLDSSIELHNHED